MCFYTANSKRAMSLAKRYGVKTDIIEMAKEIIEEQKYKINAFTHPACPVIKANQSMETARWGLIPCWVQTLEDAATMKKMCLNARSETVFSKPAFKIPILKQRCIIPATGFFEFHHLENSTIPYYIFLKDEEIFSFGGMYEQWRNPVTKEIEQTYTILTVPANELCAKIHNGGKNPFRMPLIIGRENEEQWLDTSLKNTDIQQFFQPFDASKMDAYPIARDFLKRSPDDATIIERAA
jgi:putative SOS response-associated peptidase YedK